MLNASLHNNCGDPWGCIARAPHRGQTPHFGVATIEFVWWSAASDTALWCACEAHPLWWLHVSVPHPRRAISSSFPRSLAFIGTTVALRDEEQQQPVEKIEDIDSRAEKFYIEHPCRCDKSSFHCALPTVVTSPTTWPLHRHRCPCRVSWIPADFSDGARAHRLNAVSLAVQPLPARRRQR